MLVLTQPVPDRFPHRCVEEALIRNAHHIIKIFAWNRDGDLVFPSEFPLGQIASRDNGARFFAALFCDRDPNQRGAACRRRSDDPVVLRLVVSVQDDDRRQLVRIAKAYYHVAVQSFVVRLELEPVVAAAFAVFHDVLRQKIVQRVGRFLIALETLAVRRPLGLGACRQELTEPAGNTRQLILEAAVALEAFASAVAEPRNDRFSSQDPVKQTVDATERVLRFLVLQIYTADCHDFALECNFFFKFRETHC